jgi:hypothetical protein
MLLLYRLTVKVTVKTCVAMHSPRRINSLEGSLMIEWVSLSMCGQARREVALDLPLASGSS